jgi:hypothetical protein
MAILRSFSMLTLAGALSFNVAQASALTDYNNQWQTLMNNKSADQLGNYYDKQSLLGQYPYDAAKNLIGLDNIQQMFSNGPFKLADLNVEVNSVGLSETADTAILLKGWKIDFDKGGFSGLALEVLTKNNDQWVRSIDLGAVGLKAAVDFAQQDAALDNSAFENFAAKLSEQHSAARQNLSEAAAMLNIEDIEKVDNLLSVAQGNTGLLITKVTSKGSTYLTFNALKLANDSWSLAAQLVEKL